MKCLDVKVGQAIQLGDQAVIKVAEKSGQRVRLVIATQLAIELIATGIIPSRFTTGITGERQRLPLAPMAETA
jgi:hypothetical protein